MQEESVTTDRIITFFGTGGALTPGEGLMAQIEKAGTTTTYKPLDEKILKEYMTTLYSSTSSDTVITFSTGTSYIYDTSGSTITVAGDYTVGIDPIEPSKPIYSYTQDWEKDLYLNKLLNKLRHGR